MDWYLKAVKNYAEFNGRATREEFWMFFLFNILIFLAVVFFSATLMGLLDGNRVKNLYVLAMIMPTLAVGVRRMHDANLKGWFILIPLANIYFLCLKTKEGPNRFDHTEENKIVSPLSEVISDVSAIPVEP